jgi:hypothetical protein
MITINWEVVSAERIAYWRMRLEYAPSEVHRYGIDAIEAEYQKRTGYPAHVNKSEIYVSANTMSVSLALKAGRDWTHTVTAPTLSEALRLLAVEVEWRERVEPERLAALPSIPVEDRS